MFIYNNVWRSLASLYLDDMSPDQHLTVMMAAAVTVVAIVVGGCWSYRHRRRLTNNNADSDINPNGITYSSYPAECVSAYICCFS